ncbi:MAG: ABC transporter permease [Candidatus Thermoplasmatota archaeon]|nr:ABC transporter permease [Candidatus Thermoplasmatota archaeon]MBU1940489.1 ABC transporter permease [Candidatus Thermoplasmatota archaeon]
MIDAIFSIWNNGDLTFRTIEHLTMFTIALLFASVLGVVLGIMIHQRARLADITLNLLNIIETIPGIALLFILIPLFGLGYIPTIVACILYSLLPIARNTYTGLTSVNKEYIEVAHAMGLSTHEILRRVRIPLALPLILGGIRIALVFTMGVVTLGGLVAAGGLGAAIMTGISQLNKPLIAISALWVGLLSLVFDGIASAIEKTLKRRYGSW